MNCTNKTSVYNNPGGATFKKTALFIIHIIVEILGRGPDTGYVDWNLSWLFTIPVRKLRFFTEIRALQVPSTSIRIPHEPIILRFHGVHTKLLTESLNI
jgi:hypothetical protein